MRRDESAPDEGHGPRQARPEPPESGPQEPGQSDGPAAAGQDRTEPVAGAGTDDVTVGTAAALAAEQRAREEGEAQDGEVIAVLESDRQQSPVTPAVRGPAARSWRFLGIGLAVAV